MKPLKTILVLALVLFTFSNVKSQLPVISLHVNSVLVYNNNVLEESNSTDFWVFVKPNTILIPVIDFSITIMNERFADKPLEKGGLISTYESLLTDDEGIVYPILFSIIYYEEQTCLAFDWLNGSIIYYLIDKVD